MLKQLKNPSLNDQLVALMGAFGEDLKVRNSVALLAFVLANAFILQVFSGQQAMKLLLHSERVYTDLLLALEMPDEEYRMNYILREWVDHPVGMEFRCFVFNVRKFQVLKGYFLT